MGYMIREKFFRVYLRSTWPKIGNTSLTRAWLLAIEASSTCISQFFLRDNTYELLEWLQEARSKGMSDSRDIWRYARQKETALHGA